ncbi:MAG: TonB family protein [Acidobacteria bacterium]|nr:TonB family protein [Acidobacteriota bacterium]
MIAVPAISAQSKQLSLADILIALRSKKAPIDEKNQILTTAVAERGVTFELTSDVEKELEATGASTALIAAIKDKSPKPEPAKEPVQVASSNPKPLGPAPDSAFYKGRAMGLLSAGDLDGALIELGKAIDLKPDDASLYAERGSIYVKQQKLELAINQFSLAVQRDPKDTASWFRRASAEEKLGQTDDALAHYEKAVEADNSNEPAKAAVARLKDAKAKAAAQAAKPAEQPAKVVEQSKPTETTAKNDSKPAETKQPDPKPVEPVSNEPVPAMIAVGDLNSLVVELEKPRYSEMDRRMNVQGKITVNVILDKEGKVVKVETESGPNSLRRSAEEAVRRSKFKPATVNGQPVGASGYLTFNFTATRGW